MDLDDILYIIVSCFTACISCCIVYICKKHKKQKHISPVDIVINTSDSPPTIQEPVAILSLKPITTDNNSDVDNTVLTPAAPSTLTPKSIMLIRWIAETDT